MIPILAAAIALAASACPATADAPSATCRAVAAQAAGKHAEAASEFEAGAALMTPGDPATDRMLAAAGNMWIAAGEPGKAALALDKALAGTGLLADQRGEALLDRARAAEAQGDLKTARAKVTAAAASIPDSDYLWYFSAALAIREGDAARAQQAINRALTLAPNDPAILFEAGHVAHFAGDTAKARDYWTRAATAEPNGPSGDAAKRALAMLDVPLTVQTGGATAR